MDTGSEGLEELLTILLNGVRRSTSLNEALAFLVDALMATFDLWIAAFCSVNEYSVRVEAAWSVVGTALGEGTVISADLTPGTRHLVDALRRGDVLMYSTSEIDMGLLSYILLDEAIGSWTAMPFWRGEEVVGMLVFASTSPTAFSVAGEKFFRALSGAIESTVVELLPPAAAQG